MPLFCIFKDEKHGHDCRDLSYVTYATSAERATEIYYDMSEEEGIFAVEIDREQAYRVYGYLG